MSAVSWGAVCRAKNGQTVCGDTYVLIENPQGVVLASVIDGLGGGAEAARAAQLAASVLREHSEEPLSSILRSAHTALHSTRGAVIGMLRLDTQARKAWYIGVGNIGIYAQSAHQIRPISKNGILGARLPTSLLELTYVYDPGDTFVLYSDGVSNRWSIEGKINLHLAPQVIADTTLELYGKTNDDVTVLVVRP